GWSVRKPQQSLTTQQRIDQSYGGGFSGIKNRVIDTFDANTEADRIKRFARTGLNESYEQQDARLRKQRIESELKASEAKRDAGGYSNYAPTKAANTVMSGAIRSIHGIGQGMGGLVDLVTPGKGTNRLTDFTKDYGEVWDKKREHAGVNKTAYQLAQLPMTLYGYSVGDKAITGTAQLAAKGISAIPKVGAIVPKVAGAVDTISKSKPVVAAATKLDDLALNGTRAQRVGAKLAQSYAKPGTMGNITALNTLQNAGERSSRGQDNNWGTFATDIATGLAMQGGLNLAGQAGAGVVRGVSNRITEPTTNLVQRGKSELATGLNTLNRGANQHTPYTQLVPTESGRQIVSPRDSGRVIRENLNEISEKTRARIQAAREKVPERFKLNKYGGSNADFDSPTIRNDLTGEVIPNPAYRGKNVDPLESLKQEARDIKTRTIKTADGKTEYVAQLGDRVTDRTGRETGFKATTTSPNFKSEGEMQKWISQNIDSQATQPPKSTAKTVEAKPKDAETEIVYRSEAPNRYGVGQALLGSGMYTGSKETAGRTADGQVITDGLFEYKVNPSAKILDSNSDVFDKINGKASNDPSLKSLDGRAWQQRKADLMADMIRQEGYDGVRNGTNEVVAMSDKALIPVTENAPTYKATPKPPTPFEQNLQTAGLAPKKAKGLVVSETKPLNGQKIQKVRTAPGEVEQRVVQDRSDEIADALGMTQDQREPSFNAVAAAKNSSSAKRLVEALNMNDDITQAAAQAQQDGKEINFFAKKDANGRSVGVERFDPQYHKIDAGFVTDRNGNVLGNHIKVDSTGVQVNVGGDVVNMDRVLGNPIDWRNKYEASSTMERNIYQNAPTKEIADKTYKFTVGHKIQSEANYKTELQQQRKALTDRTKATLAAKPRRVKSEEYKADLFDFIENTSTYTDMIGKYGETTAKVMSDYKTSTRTLYNDLLKRVNEQFGQFGMEQVPQRKDYLTHINELMDKKSYVGELVGQLQNSIADEGKDRTRGAIPTDIAGRSENFKPTKKWNRFFQERRGGEFTKDPFKAVDAYLEPTLHNIHMTESGVRTRAVEATFRTVSQLKNMDTSYVQKELGDSLVKFKVQGDNDKLVRGFQEYANAITGKTEALDRQIIDKSDASATALRGWQKLQSVGGRATILGNLNSVLMQPLNQIATMAQTNPANYLKGIAATISGDKTYQQSPFLKARNAKVDSYFRSKGQKFLDKGAVPLELVEKAAIRNTWNAQYQSVMKDGYKGKEAITETDRRTERTVAGRGIADRPELYRSTLANGVLQYTLEVNAQNKMFWRDLTPVQKAEFMVASSGVNMILGAVTGNTPMPDFIKAMFDSVMDFADGEDDDSVLENAGQAVQRVAGEAASMNPLVSAGANLLPKSARQVAFGKESDLGRYDGTSAPVQVVKNAVDTGSKLAQGKYTDARNSALKTVPFGNQIQKTWRGAEAISEGKTEGSPWQAAKAIAFGPNAINTDTAKETKFSATPSKSKGKVNASSVDGKPTFAPTADEILKAQFSTKEQKAWLKLSAADRKAEAEQDPEKAK
ncbi:hypothetical protein KDA08_00885, partial [Candidatus Saccharibacteria bacterium]|nr:hypothetical protein [Candidatus Saccharibacteria bacterium]